MNSHGQTHPAEKMLFKPRQLHKLTYIPLYTHSTATQTKGQWHLCRTSEGVCREPFRVDFQALP